MAPFKIYHTFFNIISNVLTQTYYALLYSLLTHICSHHVILYISQFYFQDITIFHYLYSLQGSLRGHGQANTSPYKTEVSQTSLPLPT